MKCWLSLIVIQFLFGCQAFLTLKPSVQRSYALNMRTSPDLTGDTLWRVGIKLEKPGCKDCNAIARIRFVPDKNYEPPQGRIFVEDDFNGLIKVNDKGYAGVWTLSEDKDDRKDGLWIWGLFEEPKYPFLYFYLDVFNSTILPSGEEEPIYGGMGVPNDRLNFRFDHVIEKGVGTVLSGGLINFKVTELVKADPFGVGGTVNVGDAISAGVVDIRAAQKGETEQSTIRASASENPQ